MAEVGAGEGQRGAYVAASLRDLLQRADAERVPEVARALAAAVGAGDHARGIEAVVPERVEPPAPGPERVPAAQQEGAGGGVVEHRGVLGQDLRGRLGHRDQARHVVLRMLDRDRPGAGVEVGHAQVAGLRAAQATRVAQTHRRVAGVGTLAGRRRPGRAEHAGHLVAPEDVRGERAAEGAALLAEGHVLPALRDQVFGEAVGGSAPLPERGARLALLYGAPRVHHLTGDAGAVAAHLGERPVHLLERVADRLGVLVAQRALVPDVGRQLLRERPVHVGDPVGGMVAVEHHSGTSNARSRACARSTVR